MATKLEIEEASSSGIKRNPDDWKYPKIPTNHIYKNNIFRISTSYVVKDFEETVTVSGNQQNVSLKLLSRGFLESFVKKQHNFLHLGLVQIAVNPLLREGLGFPIIVCVRDARHLNFSDSLLALVESDLSEGPFYFNCFPSFSVSLTDTSPLEVLIMSKGIPLAFRYRLVCKAMVDLNPEALQTPVLNATPYFQTGTGTCKITKWSEYELHVHEPSADEKEAGNQSQEDSINTVLDGPILRKGKSMTGKLAKEPKGNSMSRDNADQHVTSSSLTETNLEGWKYPKIPADEVYSTTNVATFNVHTLFGYKSFLSRAKNRISKFSPDHSVKEFEKTVTLKGNQKSVSIKLLKSLARKQSKYMHLGLVQVEIKPLLRAVVKGPLIVGLRDARLYFDKSFLALLKTDLSQGPFYFNHFPGYSVCMDDNPSDTSGVLMLHVMSSGIPLSLTYRVVCKITKYPCFEVRDADRTPGETSYFHPGIGTQATTKWEEVQIPESWKLT